MGLRELDCACFEVACDRFPVARYIEVVCSFAMKVITGNVRDVHDLTILSFDNSVKIRSFILRVDSRAHTLPCLVIASLGVKT
jgi:hypothetical protein